MRNLRAYYSASIKDFLAQSTDEILGKIHQNCISAETTIQQNNTWEKEVNILKNQLAGMEEGRVIFNTQFQEWADIVFKIIDSIEMLILL